MMPLRSLPLALIGLLAPLAGGLGAALAADMPDDIGYAPPPGVQEFGSNWYLRGDVGYVGYQRPSLEVGNEYWYGVPVAGPSVDDTWSIGVGFGVHVTEWLRFDVTADYRADTDFNGTVYPYQISGSFDSWTILANAYLDLGTWSGFTPYLSGGIGAASIGPKNTSDGWVFPDFDASWGFAWSVGAGVSYALDPNWSIDLGYRYVAVDDADFNDAVGNSLRIRDLSSNEIRIGARYLID